MPMEKVNGKTTVDLAAVKKQLVEEIKKKYGMNVSEFARSKYAKVIFGKSVKEGNVKSYLSDGATSLPALNKLCKHFSIGELSCEVKRITKTTYFLN